MPTQWFVQSGVYPQNALSENDSGSDPTSDFQDFYLQVSPQQILRDTG